ncbi:hypothetical protein BDP27DRAFT_1307336 [Rhodocollybia butyracea]|uniref:BTB domain-containing protein n=1 Tax=Rhodocollybia butyracea TaxID=206335 RepID=A0A9P5P6H7_9AGAR|nr:hypothetical protein BDP27DRAFT_1307336 [Rhodocollybia butyracea]
MPMVDAVDVTDEAKVISQQPTAMRSSSFYFDCVVFQVEDVLYKIPRAKLVDESKVFETMFSLPIGEGNASEGTIDENPIHLEQLAKKDWECLLRLLFHRHPTLSQDIDDQVPDFTLDEWVSVLELATKYDMTNIRKGAIDRIAVFNDPARKVKIARQQRIPSYFIPSLVELVARSEPLTPEEVMNLGIECAMKVISLRERCFDQSGCGKTSRLFRDSKIRVDVNPPDMRNLVVLEIQRVFSDHDEYYQ